MLSRVIPAALFATLTACGAAAPSASSLRDDAVADPGGSSDTRSFAAICADAASLSPQRRVIVDEVKAQLDAECDEVEAKLVQHAGVIQITNHVRIRPLQALRGLTQLNVRPPSGFIPDVEFDALPELKDLTVFNVEDFGQGGYWRSGELAFANPVGVHIKASRYYTTDGFGRFDLGIAAGTTLSYLDVEFYGAVREMTIIGAQGRVKLFRPHGPMTKLTIREVPNVELLDLSDIVPQQLVLAQLPGLTGLLCPTNPPAAAQCVVQP